MPLTQEQKKQYKSIGHHLKPVLIVAGNGLTEGVLAELERALGDHELIKIKLNIPRPRSAPAAIAELCKVGKADLVQVIGKMALIYRKNLQPQQTAVERPSLQVMARVTGALCAPCHCRPAPGSY